MTAGRSIRVVVADDQTLVREGLVGLLDLIEGVEVVGAAADGRAAVDAVRGQEVDVVLMDLRMPVVDGVEATRRIVAQCPTTRVIALSTYRDDQSIVDALSAGAAGYLTKDATAETIATAIRIVHDGGQLLAPEVQARLIDGLRSSGSGSADHGSRPGSDDARVATLTRREVQVLRLIAEGLSNAELADELCISGATVKTHVNNLFAKLHVRDRAQAVAFAYQQGLVVVDRNVPPPTG